MSYLNVYATVLNLICFALGWRWLLVIKLRKFGKNNKKLNHIKDKFVTSDSNWNSFGLNPPTDGLPGKEEERRKERKRAGTDTYIDYTEELKLELSQWGWLAWSEHNYEVEGDKRREEERWSLEDMQSWTKKVMEIYLVIIFLYSGSIVKRAAKTDNPVLNIMSMTKIMTATTELLIRFLKKGGKNIMTVKWSVGNAWFS